MKYYIYSLNEGSNIKKYLTDDKGNKLEFYWSATVELICSERALADLTNNTKISWHSEKAI